MPVPWAISSSVAPSAPRESMNDNTRPRRPAARILIPSAAALLVALCTWAGGVAALNSGRSATRLTTSR